MDDVDPLPHTITLLRKLNIASDPLASALKFNLCTNIPE